MIENTVIRLSEDAEQVERLRQKLAQYEKQLREPPSGDIMYSAPERFMAESALVRYRIEILTRLLSRGSVDTLALSHELQEEESAEGGILNEEVFQTSCTIIDGYCKGEPIDGVDD